MRLTLLEPYPVPDTEKETTSFLCDCGEKYSYTVAPRPFCGRTKTCEWRDQLQIVLGSLNN